MAGLAGETKILTVTGFKPIKDLINQQFTALVHDREYQCEGFQPIGEREVYRMTAQRRRPISIDATASHRFHIKRYDAWMVVKEIQVGDLVEVEQDNGYTPQFIPITSIEYKGTEMVYTCTLPGIGFIVANGFISNL